MGVRGSLIVPTSEPEPYTINGRVFTVVLNLDGSVSIDGVAGRGGASLDGTVIAVYTSTGYNSVEYAYQSGDTFQIGDFGATVRSYDPVSFAIPIAVVDLDGDVSVSSDLNITVNSSAISL